MNTKLVASLVALANVPSLPAGAKIAVIEGPPTEAVPFTFRLKFPANYKIPAHWHPAIEHVTVISGAINLGTGDKLDETKTKPLAAGSVAIMQPKTNHFAWTKEETIVQVHGVGHGASLTSIPRTIQGRSEALTTPLNRPRDVAARRLA